MSLPWASKAPLEPSGSEIPEKSSELRTLIKTEELSGLAASRERDGAGQSKRYELSKKTEGTKQVERQVSKEIHASNLKGDSASSSSSVFGKIFSGSLAVSDNPPYRLNKSERAEEVEGYRTPATSANFKISATPIEVLAPSLTPAFLGAVEGADTSEKFGQLVTPGETPEISYVLRTGNVWESGKTVKSDRLLEAGTPIRHVSELVPLVPDFGLDGDVKPKSAPLSGLERPSKTPLEKYKLLLFLPSIFILLAIRSYSTNKETAPYAIIMSITEENTPVVKIFKFANESGFYVLKKTVDLNFKNTKWTESGHEKAFSRGLDKAKLIIPENSHKTTSMRLYIESKSDWKPPYELREKTKEDFQRYPFAKPEKLIVEFAMDLYETFDLLSILVHLKKDIFEETEVKLLSVYGSSTFLASKKNKCTDEPLCLSSEEREIAMKMETLTWNDNTLRNFGKEKVEEWIASCFHESVQRQIDYTEIKPEPGRQPSLISCANSIKKMFPKSLFESVNKDIEQDIYVNSALLRKASSFSSSIDNERIKALGESVCSAAPADFWEVFFCIDSAILLNLITDSKAKLLDVDRLDNTWSRWMLGAAINDVYKLE